MPLPQQQLDRMAVDLQNHERERQALEASPGYNDQHVRSRIEFHQVALQVGRDQKILAALGEIHDDPKLIDQLASNPDKFLQSRSIHLPTGVTRIVVKNLPSQPVQAEIQFQRGNLFFSLLWDQKAGFGARQLPPKA